MVPPAELRARTHAFRDGATELRRIREQRRKQQALAFNLQWGTVLVGTCILFAGVLVAYLQSVSLGLITGAVGVVSNATGIVMRFTDKSSKALDEVTTQLIKIEQAALASKAAEEMPDKTNQRGIAIQTKAAMTGQDAADVALSMMEESRRPSND